MRRALAAFVLALLISALIGTLFVNWGIANPMPPGFGPSPTITIQLSENRIYTKNDITIAFTVEGAQELASVMLDPHHYHYLLDGNRVDFIPSQVSRDSHFYFCEASLTDLSEGDHRLRIVVSLRYECLRDAPVIASGISDEVVFTVDTAVPQILILSLTPYETYNVTSLPLEFTVSEPVNWLGYSLDGEEPVTITGNTTLYGLSEGSHSVVVHAEDTAGSTGSSRLVTFEVDTETEADSTDSTESGSFPTTLIIAVVILVSVIAVSAGLLFYFRKHKH